MALRVESKQPSTHLKTIQREQYPKELHVIVAKLAGGTPITKQQLETYPEEYRTSIERASQCALWYCTRDQNPNINQTNASS